MDRIRNKLISVRSSRYYTQMEPSELVTLYNELRLYLDGHDDSKIDELTYLSLMEMLFYVSIYLSKDIEAQVIYKTLTDEFGENSPVLYTMKSILIQVDENDQKSIEYIDNLIDTKLEYDTDPLSYLLLNKRKLSMILKNSSIEVILAKTLELIDKFPNDPELWWFAGQIYFDLGKFDESIFAFEEIVLIQPFNYMAFYKIAEMNYFKFVDSSIAKSSQSQSKKSISELQKGILDKSLKNALRSIELNELFLQGWSIVALVSKLSGNKESLLALSHKKLNEIANSKDNSKKDINTAKLMIEKTK